ncbi:MAG: flagellar biosynthetic protein FliO [Desulfocapsaceae bacterium]|nr:flagellar biosynthetic protein FliO [Desulfocapsaceae bacterium]
MNVRRRLCSCLAFLAVLSAESGLCAGEQQESVFSAPLRLIWGLLVVLGILFIIYGLMKKKLSFLHMPDKGVIKIIEVRHLQPKKSLYLIDVRGQEFLLGAGQDRIELIAAISPDSRASFAETLEKSAMEHTP